MLNWWNLFFFQLEHIFTSNYIHVSSRDTSEMEPSNMMVYLSKNNAKHAHFRVMPRYKVKAEGDLVRGVGLVTKADLWEQGGRGGKGRKKREEEGRKQERSIELLNNYDVWLRLRQKFMSPEWGIKGDLSFIEFKCCDELCGWTATIFGSCSGRQRRSKNNDWVPTPGLTSFAEGEDRRNFQIAIY